MRSKYLKSLKAAVLSVTVLLLGVGVSFAAQQVNLVARPATATMPDGSIVPMWGYACNGIVSGSTAVCSAANPAAVGGWSPVVITVPAGDLTITLTNNLSFAPIGSATAKTVQSMINIVRPHVWMLWSSIM